jgi:hypothetical protein
MTMNIQSDWLSIYIAVMGIVISGLLTYLSYSLNRQSQKASTQRSIDGLYDEMIKYRTAHPEVLRLCYRWNKDSFDAVYRQLNAEEIQWVIYYNYVEIVCGFLNAVLHGRKNRLLDHHAYESHYKSLVKLLVTEHYPYFLVVLKGPYISALIREFIRDLKGEGWDFSEKHKILIGAVFQSELQTPVKARKAQSSGRPSPTGTM